MANKPFDRVILNDKERPVSRDINRLQSELDYGLREFARQNFAGKAALATNLSAVRSGFLGDSFYVDPDAPVGMSVVVRAGLGFQNDPGGSVSDIGGILGLDDRSLYKPLMLVANQTITGVPAADPANPRIDIVEVRYNRAVTDSEARDQLTLATGVFASVPLNKTLSFALDTLWSINGALAINYKTGIAAGVPVAPATSPGYIKIAEVDIPALSVSILASRIRDLRSMLFPGGVCNIGVRFVSALGGAPYTNLTVAAPPGVLVATYNPSGGGVASKARVGIIAGAGFVSAAVTTAIGTGVASTAFIANHANVYGPSTITVGDQGNFAGATANPVLTNIAVGQPYWLTEFDLYQITGIPGVLSGIVPLIASNVSINWNLRT